MENEHASWDSQHCVSNGFGPVGNFVDLCNDDSIVRNGASCSGSQPDFTEETKFACSQTDIEEEIQSQNFQSKHAQTLSHERSKAFVATVNMLRELKKSQRELLASKVPENRSKIFAHLARQSMDSKNVFVARDVRARATQGVIQVSSNDDYHTKILPLIASDVDNNTVSTLFEYIDVKYHGVRLFAKLLYGTFDTLPTQDIIDTHYRIAYKLATECFPIADTTIYDAATRQWIPRFKYNNNARADSLPMARQSTAIVWPHIVVHDPEELLRFWKVLDMRLTEHSPQFANPVDMSALRISSSRARLQSVFSHKSVPCRNCRVLVDGLANYESSDEECQTRPKYQQQPSKRQRVVTKCVCDDRGIVVQEGSVQPTSELRWNDHALFGAHILRWNTNVFSQQAKRLTTLEMLQLHSIIPVYADSERSRVVRFHSPVDAPNERDAIGYNVNDKQHSPFGRDILCKLDSNKFFTKILKMKTTVPFEAVDHIDLYRLCTDLIRKVGSPANLPLKLPCKQEIDSNNDDNKRDDHPYAHIVIHDIVCNTTKKRLYINVQGRGSKYCYLHGADHTEARIYFTIAIETFYVSVSCNDPSCQKITTSYFDWLIAKKEPSKKKKQIDEPKLTDEQKDLLNTKMYYVIPIDGDARTKLTRLSLNKEYTGPKTLSLALQQSLPSSSSSNSQRQCINSSYENEISEDDSDQELDHETQTWIPRRIVGASLSEKIAFINKRNARKRAKKSNQTIPTPITNRLASTEPFVEEVKLLKPTPISLERLEQWKNAPSKFLS